MKVNEIVAETTSAVVASVSFPLFGKKEMIRRAVDPYGYIFPKGKKKKPKKKKSMVYTDKVKSVYPSN